MICINIEFDAKKSFSAVELVQYKLIRVDVVIDSEELSSTFEQNQVVVDGGSTNKSWCQVRRRKLAFVEDFAPKQHHRKALLL